MLQKGAPAATKRLSESLRERFGVRNSGKVLSAILDSVLRVYVYLCIYVNIYRCKYMTSNMI